MKIMTSPLWYQLGSCCAFFEHFYYPLGQLKYLVLVLFLWNDIWNWAQMLIILNEWLWTSVQSCFPGEGGGGGRESICKSLQTWFICILIILITQLVQRKFIISQLLQIKKMTNWWYKISNFINVTVKWSICNVLLSYYLIEKADWTSCMSSNYFVIEPDGYYRKQSGWLDIIDLW